MPGERDSPFNQLALLETGFHVRKHLGYGERDIIPIGDHLDDWIDTSLIMSDVLLMGYPRVPFAARMPLVPVAGQVSLALSRYDVSPVHFVISTMARRSFSGGPVISEYDFLLGVATEVLVHKSITETGFTAVLSVEQIWDLSA